MADGAILGRGAWTQAPTGLPAFQAAVGARLHVDASSATAHHTRSGCRSGRAGLEGVVVEREACERRRTFVVSCSWRMCSGRRASFQEIKPFRPSPIESSTLVQSAAGKLGPGQAQTVGKTRRLLQGFFVVVVASIVGALSRSDSPRTLRYRYRHSFLEDFRCQDSIGDGPKSKGRSTIVEPLFPAYDSIRQRRKAWRGEGSTGRRRRSYAWCVCSGRPSGGAASTSRSNPTQCPSGGSSS